MELTNESENITLKQLELSHADKIFTLIDKNREYLAPWFWWVKETKSVDDSLRFLEIEKEKYEKKTGITCGIWYREELVGLVSLNEIDIHTNSAVIGYWLDNDFQGKGIMTNSCKLLINYAFKVLKLHRIEILHAEQNEKSKAVIQRLGFVHEGHFREATLVNGKYLDDEFYSLLESEWKE